jgi:putative acetyltransferase
LAFSFITLPLNPTKKLAVMSQFEPSTSPVRNRNSVRPNLVVRPIHPDDATDIYAIISDPKVAVGADWIPVKEYLQIKEWAANPNTEQHRLVAEMNGTVVGVGWLIQKSRPRINHIGQTELIVQPDHWGQRIGTSLAIAILDLADKWLNLKRVEASVVSNNERAIRMLQNLGFDVEGTRRASLYGDGQWQDENLLARLRGFEKRSDSSEATELVKQDGPFEKLAIENRYLSVRPIQPDDVSALYDIFRRPEVCRTTLQLPSQEIGLTEDRVFNPPAGIHRLVAVVDEQIVGTISLKQRQNPRRSHSAGLGMMVHPNYWGQGIGTCLMESILDLADNWLNLKRIDLDVNVDNSAGIRLYKKFGFVVEGTKRYHIYGDGRWTDSYFMARLK